MIRNSFSLAHDHIDEMLKEYQSYKDEDKNENGVSVEAPAKKTKLDILSKILAMPETPLQNEDPKVKEE